MIGTTVSHYKILEKIGGGGMGVVYRARDLKLDRFVALKFLPPELTLDPEAKGRFVHEAKAASALQHTNICTIHDIDETDDGSLYIVMDCYEGESLTSRIATGPMQVKGAVDVALQVASGLSKAHEKGIVHRDIKPGNVFITTDGTVKILDFGLAKLAGGQTRLTRPGSTVGTAAYMSPEQAQGMDVDERTDIWSVGVVLYEMLTGKLPFRGEHEAALLYSIVHEEPQGLVSVRADVPRSVAAIIEKALQKECSRRYQSMKQMVSDLKSALVPVLELPKQEKSIVVLPFENLSPDPDNAFFADGLTEELIADLSKIRALRVISRTSAMLLKGSKKDVQTIGRDLSVRYVLEGSVRRAGDSLRITAQLIDAASDTHMWAEKYAGKLEDVFALQEQLSRRIVQALELTLTPDEDRHLASRDIPDVEAFALYLRARQEILRASESAFDLALQLVERALARTGPNALLLATEAEILWFLHDQGIRPVPETLQRGDGLADQALELVPTLARAHVAKGLIAWRRFDPKTSVRHLRRAVELDPGDAIAAWSAGYVLAEVGLTAEARELGDRAHALDPLYWPAHVGSAFADLFDGRFDTGLAKMVGMHTAAAGIPVADLWLGVFLLYVGRADEAAQVFDRGARAGAGVVSSMQSFVGAMLRSDREAMYAVLAQPGAREVFEIDKEFSWMFAAAFASVGDAEVALRWLARAIEMGFINHRFFAEHDPFLSRLRGDPRFEALMDRARAKQREIEADV